MNRHYFTSEKHVKTQKLYIAVALVAALVTGYWLAYARFAPAAGAFDTLRKLLGV